MEKTKQEEKAAGREEMLATIEKQRPDMGEKLKKLVEKEGFLKSRNVYGELYADRQINICYDAIFHNEFLRCRILEALKEEAKSVKQLAEQLDLPPGEILWEVVELRRKNLVLLERVEDRTPLYRSAG